MKKDLDIFYSKINYLCLNENMEKTRKKVMPKVQERIMISQVINQESHLVSSLFFI